MTSVVPVPRREAPIVNYEGIPLVFEFEGRHFFALQSSDNSRCVEVSRGFFNSFVREFAQEFKDTDETIRVCVDELHKRTTEFLVMRKT